MSDPVGFVWSKCFTQILLAYFHYSNRNVTLSGKWRRSKNGSPANFAMDFLLLVSNNSIIGSREHQIAEEWNFNNKTRERRTDRGKDCHTGPVTQKRTNGFAAIKCNDCQRFYNMSFPSQCLKWYSVYSAVHFVYLKATCNGWEGVDFVWSSWLC